MQYKNVSSELFQTDRHFIFSYCKHFFISKNFLNTNRCMQQPKSAGAAKYTDYVTVEESDSLPTSVLIWHNTI